MKEPKGHIVCIKEQTSSYMTLKLDNGVSIDITLSNGLIHLNLSGIEYEKGISIREAGWGGTPIKLANYVTVEYESQKDS